MQVRLKLENRSIFGYFQFFDTKMTQIRSSTKMLVNFQQRSAITLTLLYNFLGVHFLPVTSSSTSFQSLRGSK